MPATTEPGPGDGRWRRIGWFVLLYAAGLAVTLVAAYLLRSLLPGVD
jgi:hypothetical protein